MYYANKEIETLHREYLQSIAALFFSNKRIRLTASVLLPCVHSCLEYLCVKKNKYSSPWGEREGLARNTHGTHIALRLTIGLVGIDDPCLRQRMRILVLRKTDTAAHLLSRQWHYGRQMGLNTLTKCKIDYIHPSFLPVSFTWWLG